MGFENVLLLNERPLGARAIWTDSRHAIHFMAPHPIVCSYLDFDDSVYRLNPHFLEFNTASFYQKIQRIGACLNIQREGGTGSRNEDFPSPRQKIPPVKYQSLPSSSVIFRFNLCELRVIDKSHFSLQNGPAVSRGITKEDFKAPCFLDQGHGNCE